MGHVTDSAPQWEGVVDDQAYLFHGIQMLPGAYGAGWARTLMDIFALTIDTVWAMPNAAIAVLARFLVEV